MCLGCGTLALAVGMAENVLVGTYSTSRGWGESQRLLEKKNLQAFCARMMMRHLLVNGTDLNGVTASTYVISLPQ